ncbi:hypothetical protein FSARC_6505 [Fusarium sarcochroum]|uniref:Zn(2)-C6 fungal-type domain-containing protein n=1 Tax=Fusarium sarcochroum TaxID=1208366 RepID=A0A8H4TX81_9HYPO|nr:hypothetical protein FSARC_6505 [Fusarium sarcochroum]
MGRKSKQKSCFACVETKRRCDKRFPSCSRCLDRDSICTYPPVPLSRQRPPLDFPGATVAPDMGFGDVWTPLAFDNGMNSVTLLGQASGSTLLDSDLTTSLFYPTWLSSLSAPSSSTMVEPSSQLTPQIFGDLDWFLRPQAWTIAYGYHPPDAIPPASVFSNFIRGLQDWLSRFVKKGHNPFIHRHLYSDSGYPQCIQDAYSACVISNAVNDDNDNIIDAISSTHISNLLNSQPASNSMSPGVITTMDHLARTQALLIHILLAVFSPSIQRRARGESLISTLHTWSLQLWDCAAQDSAVASPVPAIEGLDPIPRLYRAFILSESIRRTVLICNVATGVYNGLKGDTTESCGGDIQITTQAKFWEAPSSARWEVIARHTDPLFIYSLKGQALLESGVGAAQVDEFARHLFTVMLGMEKVETWVVRTGDEVSVVY